MARPVGVIILAVLNFIGAAFCLLGALVMFVMGGAGLVGATSNDQAAAGLGAMLGTMGAIAGVVFLLFAVISVVVGVGLLKLRNWARILTIVFGVIFLLLCLLGLAGNVMHFNVVGLVWSLLWVAIYAWIVYYMFQPHVKQAFGA